MNDNIIPKFILAAQPEEKIDIPDFFIESQDNIFFEKLKEPEYLRYSGWNMRTLDYPKIKNGTYWEVKNGNIKTIRLYRDGSLVSVADANEDFLGWGAKTYEDYVTSPKLLALALIEYIYEFVQLYKVFLKKFPTTEHVLFKFGFKNVEIWEGKRLILKPNEIYALIRPSNESVDANQIAKDFMTEIPLKLEKDMYNSEVIAYKIVEEIFIRFNISIEKIPYVKQNELGQKVIDVEKIRNIR